MAVELAPGFFQVGGRGLTHPLDGNAYCVVNRNPKNSRLKQVVLIDATGNFKNVDYERGTRPVRGARYPNIVHQLGSIGIHADEVETIWLTHIHYDHASAMEKFKNAQVYVGAGELPAARSRDPYLHATFLYGKTTPLYSNLLTIEHGQQINVGRNTIEAIATPGHTKGSMTYIVTGEQDSTLVTGDHWMGGYHPLTGSDLNAWSDSIDLTNTYDFDFATIGHVVNHRIPDAGVFKKVVRQAFCADFYISHDGSYINNWYDFGEYTCPYPQVENNVIEDTTTALLRRVADPSYDVSQYSRYRDILVGPHL